MRPIERDEVLSIRAYEPLREHFRARVMAEKRARRISLGAHMSAVFENRDTVLLQIQEMLRTERITSEAAIQHEIDTYNDLIAADNELSLTLFVEVPEAQLREDMLVKLAGLENCVSIDVDSERFVFSGKREGASDGRTTAVHYLKAKLSPSCAQGIRDRSAITAIVIHHKLYQARCELGATTLASIAGDLG